MLILVLMLQGGWAQQTTGEQPTTTLTPETQELTPEKFFEEFFTALQANDEQRFNQLITEYPETAQHRCINVYSN